MERIIHDLVQGSDEWHQFRFEHDGASEAAPMLALSKKTSRTELLRMKHTGIAKEFSDWVLENVIEPGHEVEAMARPLIEQEIGHLCTQIQQNITMSLIPPSAEYYANGLPGSGDNEGDEE